MKINYEFKVSKVNGVLTDLTFCYDERKKELIISRFEEELSRTKLNRTELEDLLIFLKGCI